MFSILRTIINTSALSINKPIGILSVRTFLSQAYYCEEVWEHRLNSTIISKVKIDDLYQDLDQRFGKTGQISPVDVDIFANAVSNEFYTDELLDIIHKLRLSASSSSMLDSTPHAVIRFLLKHKKYEELVKVLDDRLNYGIFLDHYSTNLLLDTFYKNEDFTSGARIASQLMLQEDMTHALSTNLGLLHCYKYLLDPKDWPQELPPEEPEDEVKIRVKYLRNPYFDDHFDLRDPKKIIGKTLCMGTKGVDNSLDKSFYLVGLELYGNTEKASQFLDELSKQNSKLYSEILNLLPEDNVIRKSTVNITESANIDELLKNRIVEAERKLAEQDIALQCELYSKWTEQRKVEVEKQHERLLVQQRLANIENIQKELKDRETKLWFFENEEKIELAIEARKVFYPKRWFGKKKKPRKIDEGYVPPEIK